MVLIQVKEAGNRLRLTSIVRTRGVQDALLSWFPPFDENCLLGRTGRVDRRHQYELAIRKRIRRTMHPYRSSIPTRRQHGSRNVPLALPCRNVQNLSRHNLKIDESGAGVGRSRRSVGGAKTASSRSGAAIARARAATSSPREPVNDEGGPVRGCHIMVSPTHVGRPRHACRRTRYARSSSYWRATVENANGEPRPGRLDVSNHHK